MKISIPAAPKLPTKDMLKQAAAMLFSASLVSIEEFERLWTAVEEQQEHKYGAHTQYTSRAMDR